MEKNPEDRARKVLTRCADLFEAHSEMWMQGDSIGTGENGDLIQACSLEIIG